MIYITGDTHGSPARLSRESMPFAERWTKRDTLIVCGDFGYLFTGGPKEELALRELSFPPTPSCLLTATVKISTCSAPTRPRLGKAAWHGGFAATFTT